MSSENRKKPNKLLSFLWMVFLGIVFGVCAAFTFTGLSLISTIGVIPAVEKQIDYSKIALEENLDPVKNPEDGGHAQLPEEKEEILEQVEDIVMSNEEYTVSEVAENCMPAVVLIRVLGEYDYNGYKVEGESAGSGIIVGESDTELLIATNYHVVEDEKSITIYFCD